MIPKPIYLYQCPQNHVDYGWEDKGDQPQCPECAARMKRMDQPKKLDMDREGYWLKKTNKNLREIKRLTDFEVAMLKLVGRYDLAIAGKLGDLILEALDKLDENRKKDS